MYCKRFNKKVWRSKSNVRFMSYSKCWDCHWTWNLCFLFIFSWKQASTELCILGRRGLNSKEIKFHSSIRVICIVFDLIFFSWKSKIKQIFQVRRLFQRFGKCRIWHELHICRCDKKWFMYCSGCRLLSNVNATFVSHCAYSAFLYRFCNCRRK